jgi:WD40 repeat protein
MEPVLTVNTSVSLSQWSQDGKLIAGVSNDYHGISIYDANTGNLVKTVSSEEIMIEGAAWSPDNENFAIMAGAKTIGIIDLVQGRITGRFPQEARISGLIWSPDSSYLAYAGFAEVTVGTSGSITSSGSTTGAVLHSVYIVDSSNGQIVQRFNGLPDYTIRLLWSSNGSELIAASRSGDIFVWNAITGEEIEHL